MKDWFSRYGRGAGMIAAVVLAAASYLLPSSLAARWVATTLLLLALPSAWRCWAPVATTRLDALRSDWRELAARWLPYLAVAIGTLIALGPIALGEMPVSQDHANHYLSTHILVNDLIPSGRFFGWTDRYGTGYPFGDLYSTPCYLFTGLLHLVSFGLVDLHVSYAFGVALAWLIPALAIAAWARRLGGPWGAVIAGLAFALDVGSDREGGWTYSMFHGVWPQQLGAGLWLFALLALWRLTEKATTRRLAAAVLLAGTCLWIHPMNAIALLAGGLVIAAIRLLGSRAEGGSGASPDSGAIRLIAALAMAGLIGLVWVVRMMLAGDVVYAYPVYWRPLAELMGALLDGGPFDHQIAAVGILALIGIARAVRDGGRFAWLAVILPAILLLFGSMELVTGSDLGLAGGKLGVMQYRRFSIHAKPLWYALAGSGLTAVGYGLATGLARKAARRTRGLAFRVLIALLLAPCVWGAVAAFPGLVRSPAARPLTLARSGEQAHVAAIAALLEQEAADIGGPARAVYWEKAGHGGRYPMLAIADEGWSFLSTKIIPCNNFRWINWTTAPEKMARLGTRLVISRWEQQHELLEKLGTFGIHHVYRVKGVARDEGRFELIGPGRVEVTSWEPERRVLRITGADAGTRLVLMMPPYRKWTALQQGRKLRIQPRQEGGLLLSEVHGVGDGELLLEFRDGAIENAVTAIGALLLFASIAGLILRPRPLPSPWGDRATARVERTLSFALAALFAAGIAAVLIGSGAAVDREWLTGEPAGSSIGAVLHRSGHRSVDFSPSLHCVAAHSRDPGWECSEHDLQPVLQPARRRSGLIPSCLAVGVPPGGRTEISFDLPAGTSSIKGRLHLLAGAVSDISLHTDGAGSESLGAPSKRGNPFEARVAEGAQTAVFEITSKPGKPSRVCIEAVALSRSGN